MKYETPKPLTKAIAEAELHSGDPHRIREALVALALNEPDWQWVQDVCLKFASSSDTGVRAICATSLGHLARIHGILDLPRVVPVLRNLMKDPETKGYAQTALGDIKMFIGAEAVERIWTESLSRS